MCASLGHRQKEVQRRVVPIGVAGREVPVPVEAADVRAVVRVRASRAAFRAIFPLVFSYEGACAPPLTPYGGF